MRVGCDDVTRGMKNVCGWWAASFVGNVGVEEVSVRRAQEMRCLHRRGERREGLWRLEGAEFVCRRKLHSETSSRLLSVSCVVHRGLNEGALHPGTGAYVVVHVF